MLLPPFLKKHFLAAASISGPVGSGIKHCLCSLVGIEKRKVWNSSCSAASLFLLLSQKFYMWPWVQNRVPAGWMGGLVRASCWQEGVLLSVSWHEIDWITTALVSYWGTFKKCVNHCGKSRIKYQTLPSTSSSPKLRWKSWEFLVLFLTAVWDK